MNKDKRVLYITSLIIFAVLLGSLFVDLGSSKIVTACILLPAAVAVWLFIRKRTSVSINKREVLLLTSVMAAIYVMLKEMSGIYFGFYKNPYFVNAELLIKHVLPLAVIIASVEVIRYVVLAQKSKLADFITYLSCVLAEILTVSSLSGITSFNGFMDLVGMALFPALSANIYYHYVSKNYGMWPNITFRMITTLYIYFIKSAAAMTDALSACIKMILPMIMLTFISAMFGKTKKNAVQKGRKLGGVGVALTVIVTVSAAMLISCQFRFGALVIATDSMTGEVNKGDMIIYERYDGQPIEEGQIIVFLQDESKIVHRVVQIQNINGETRYYTKGDANEDMDMGYRTEADIVGLTDVKVAYVGYPTLWLRELIPN